MTRLQLLAIAVAVPVIAVGAEMVVLSVPRSQPAEPTALSPVPLGTPPASAATGAGTPVGAPTPAGNAGYAYVATPTPQTSAEPGAPRILEVDVTDRVVHAPGRLAFRVLTSDDVVLVRAQLLGREIRVPRLGAGVFAASGTIPDIPSPLYGDKTVTVVATTVDGRRAESTITVRVEH